VSLADKILDVVMPWFLLVMAVVIGLLFVYLVVPAIFDGKKCAIYSEEKEKHGFIMSGKVPVHTTYRSRDCLVYEGDK